VENEKKNGKGVAKLVSLYRSAYRKTNPVSIVDLQDEQILSFLIGEQAAHSIMQQIGTAEGFFDLKPEEITRLSGVGEGTAMMLELIGEWILRCLGEREGQPSPVAVE
jgi:hypothetical protein